MGEAGEKQNAAAKAMGFDVIPRSAFVSAETGKPLYNTGQKPVHTDGGVFDPDEAAFHHWWADRDRALHQSVHWKSKNAKVKTELAESQARLKKLAYVAWMASREALRLAELKLGKDGLRKVPEEDDKFFEVIKELDKILEDTNKPLEDPK